MQRIAYGTGLIFLAFCGCAGRRTGTVGAPPDPLMNTRHARATYARPTPAPRIAPPRPAPQWSPPPATALNKRDILPSNVNRSRWKSIVVHHSASDRDTPESMHRYHLQRGWSRGLGYHFVIGNGVNFPDGKIYVGPRWQKQQTGAHCASDAGRYFGSWRSDNFFNEHGIGICLIGNFENRGPTEKQLESLEQLTQLLCDELDISQSNIYGHGAVTHKTACPGRFLTGKLAELRKTLALGQRGVDSVN